VINLASAGIDIAVPRIAVFASGFVYTGDMWVTYPSCVTNV